MKKFYDFLYSNPIWWIFLYMTLICTVAVILASFRPVDNTSSKSLSSDSAGVKISDKNIQTAAIQSNLNRNKKPKVSTGQEDEDTIKQNKVLKEYLVKYKAVDFNDYNYSYTIDYQENMEDKTIIFYILVDDIYEDKGKTFVKSAKSYLGMNIYFKLMCDPDMLGKMKKAQFYVYVVVKVEEVSTIYFNTEALKEDEKEEVSEIDVTFASNGKNLLITGACYDMFE